MGDQGLHHYMGPAAYLLCTASLHQCCHHYLLQCTYIPGPANMLADIALCHFDLSDDELLHLLPTLSPHSQKWQMLTTSPKLVSQLICDLLWKRPYKLYLHNVPIPLISSGPTIGCHTQNHWAWTPSYPLWQTKYPTSVSSCTASDPAPPAAVVSRSRLHMYVMKSSPLRRGSPTWVDQTHASCLLDLWTHGSPSYIEPTPMKILPHIMSNHSPFNSFTTPWLSSTPHLPQNSLCSASSATENWMPCSNTCMPRLPPSFETWLPPCSHMGNFTLLPGANVPTHIAPIVDDL